MRRYRTCHVVDPEHSFAAFGRFRARIEVAAVFLERPNGKLPQMLPKPTFPSRPMATTASGFHTGEPRAPHCGNRKPRCPRHGAGSTAYI